jgi:tetratricopeptide (TPR) repeat protein
LEADADKLPEALQHYQESRKLREALVKETNDAKSKGALARSYERLGRHLQDKEEKESCWTQALQIYRQLAAPAPGELLKLVFLFEPLRQVGSVKGAKGERELGGAMGCLCLYPDSFKPYTDSWIESIQKEIKGH